jgi:CHAT domain-containing protein/tetratricopeptide (TPR) repeat protein
MTTKAGFRSFERAAAQRLLAALVVASAAFASLHAQGPGHAPTLLPTTTQTAASGEAGNLDLGKPLERALTGAETHRYRLRLQTGEYALVQVEQRGIDVIVQLLGGDNEVLAEADDAITAHGTEKLDFVADHDGSYSIQVTPKLKLAAGAYEIRLAEIHATTSPDRTLYEVRQLRAKVHRLREIDQFGPALPLAERALTLATQALGPDDVYVAWLTANLADIKYGSGKPAEAKAGFEKALQVLTAKLGAEHPQVLFVKTRLGSLYNALGDLSRADELLSQALESEEKTLGRDDPMVATTLKSLAILHSDRSDNAKAEVEDLRALAILDKAGLTEQAIYGELLNNLGVVYNGRNELDKAQQYYDRDLAFLEKHFPESDSLSKLLNNLGVIARKRGDYAAAEKYYMRALALKEKHLGAEHPEYAAVLMNLANVYGSEGDYPKALDTQIQALHIFEKNPDDGPPILSMANIAKLYAAVGDIENANKMQARLDSALEEDISLNLALGSEREKFAYLDWISQRTDRTISLNLQLEPGSPQAAAMAATVLLQRKGRLLDATADTFGALRKHSSPEDQALLDQLKEATTQFARLALQGPQKQTHEQYRRGMDELQERKERLENAMSHRSEEFRASSQAVSLDAVRATIPDNAALVEFVTYRPFYPKAKTDAEQYGDLRYGVYVLRRDAAPRGLDLGDAKKIDSLVGRFRDALRDPDRSDASQLARALAEKVFQPVESLVADGKRLLISPDGQLDLVPFEALQDTQGHYLVERFSVTYLTTGRDLLRMQVPRSSQTAPVIVADPFFGEPQSTLVANAAVPQTKLASAKTDRASITTGPDFSSLYFAELSGTKAEAERIFVLFPEARLLIGKQASEHALDQLSGPKILHIATHGFFLQDLGGHADSQAGRNDARGRVAADLENPLLRSGLALSGANLVQNGKGEGILTALEASNLDLWGTKLVTLSACDTGVGEVKNGDGVYGLRRSFFLAGAETLVMSLWPVSDHVTREIMTVYYTGLKKGLGRGEALRQAELAMMKQKGRQHPFYWASFIQSGEWANLDGQR